MPDSDDVASIRAQLDVLHQAMTELVEIQRQVLAQEPASPAIEAAAGQLHRLRDRLRPYAQAAADSEQKLSVQEIDAERINIVESDGRLRLTISNTELAPDPIIGGRTAKRSGGNSAGMIFFNEQGDECGGLAFSGEQKDGKRQASAALLFDQFNQDQTVGIQYSEEDGRRSAGLTVWDRPESSLSELVDRLQPIYQMPEGLEREAAMQEVRATSSTGATRVFVGKTPDKSAALTLADPFGTVRLRLRVDAAGEARLEFLDEKSQVTYSLPES